MSQNTVRIIDLFAGLGGIRLGFEQAMKEIGFETKCVFSSEIKKYAIKAYQGYFGNEKVNGDITQIPADDIPDFDFLLAGFPASHLVPQEKAWVLRTPGERCFLK